MISQASPLALMASNATVEQILVAKNEYMMRDIIRQNLGVKGIIISDTLAISFFFTTSKTVS